MVYSGQPSISKYPALAALVSFATGILLDMAIDVPWQYSLAATLVLSACWAFSLATKWGVFSSVIVLLAVAGAGSYWHHVRWNLISEDDLLAYCNPEPQLICLRAELLGDGQQVAKSVDDLFDPRPADDRSIYRIAPRSLRDGDQWVPVGGIANLVVQGHVDHLVHGDQIFITGKLVRIRPPRSPGMFDYQAHSRAAGVSTVVHVFYPDAVRLEQRETSWSTGSLISFLRRHFNSQLQRYVSWDQSGFAAAILLGDRMRLPPETRELFMTTGTAHLLAISGLHLGILVSVFYLLYMLGIVKRKSALWLSIAFVLFYVVLIDFRPPVTRAAVLVTLFCIVRLWGFNWKDFNLLGLAGLFVLMINPNDIWQLAPQLSFLAIASMIMFKDWLFPARTMDPIELLIRKSRPWWIRLARRIAENGWKLIAASTLIWLMGLPLVSSHFHLVTLSAGLVNPLVIVAVWVALISGLGVCVFGGWLPFVPAGFGGVCGYVLKFVVAVVGWGDQWSWGHWWTSGPQPIALYSFYGMLLVWAMNRARWGLRGLGFLYLGWLAMAWLLPEYVREAHLRSSAEQTSVVFLDVGHGSSTIIRLPHGVTILYDAGSMSSSEFASDVVSQALWKERIRHLDAVVISHSDLDHFNAVPRLIERFSIGMIYVSRAMAEQIDPVIEDLFQRLHRASFPVRSLSRHDQVTLAGGAAIRVLLPDQRTPYPNDNANSIVLSIELGGKKILLPGDLEGEGLDSLLGMPGDDWDVVLLPHHGSKNSRPRDFTRWSSPEYAVISAARNTLNGEVVQEVASHKCRVFSTADFGSLRLSFDGSRIKWDCWSYNRWITFPEKTHHSSSVRY